MLTFDTLDAMLDYLEAHEDECDMYVTETRAYLAEKGDCTKKISNEIYDQRCFIACFGGKKEE